jgi:hypothetical protein
MAWHLERRHRLAALHLPVRAPEGKVIRPPLNRTPRAVRRMKPRLGVLPVRFGNLQRRRTVHHREHDARKRFVGDRARLLRVRVRAAGAADMPGRTHGEACGRGHTGEEAHAGCGRMARPLAHVDVERIGEEGRRGEQQFALTRTDPNPQRDSLLDRGNEFPRLRRKVSRAPGRHVRRGHNRRGRRR